MSITIRIELEPGAAGYNYRAISVTIDGVEKKVETYNSVPTVAELPKEETPVVEKETKGEEENDEEEEKEKEEEKGDKEEKDYAEGKDA